jgi:hypothetical protein
MNGNWMRLRDGRNMLLAIAALLAVATADATAQVNVAGAWAMEVTTDAGGTTNPTMTLEQNGTALTGHYSSTTLGEADVTGTVDGNRVTIRFAVDMQGQEVPVMYVATVDAAGVMTGTIDLAGGLASGTFTARRAN